MTVRHGIYIGPLSHLKDKGALVLPPADGRVQVQFDDVTTGYGYGWHDFGVEDFELGPSSSDDGSDLL